jgi:hypothetical protein
MELIENVPDFLKVDGYEYNYNIIIVNSPEFEIIIYDKVLKGLVKIYIIDDLLKFYIDNLDHNRFMYIYSYNSNGILSDGTELIKIRCLFSEHIEPKIETQVKVLRREKNLNYFLD